MAFLDNIKEICNRVAVDSGLEVVEVEMRGSGKTRMLRVFLDKPWNGEAAEVEASVSTGVTHEDCATFSREVSRIFDVEDAVPGGSYTLEVSSPGLDRKLYKPTDYQRFQGSLLKLSTFEPINGNRHFIGRLTAFSGDRLTLDLAEATSKKTQKQQGTGTVDIAYSNVEKANLVPEI
jgi:ribosome maturation factor RimP